MKVLFSLEAKMKVPAKIWASDLEAEAEAQIMNLAGMPFVFNHVAVMPDAHAGKGSTVGTVIATKGAIIPAAVGVDIGCGMAAVKLPFKIDVLGGSEKLAALRHSIERAIPTGRHGHKELNDRQKASMKNLMLKHLGAPYTVNDAQVDKASSQLGTLGGGNHFIEICTDLEGNAWIMLHSGSRNIGKVLAEKHIDAAKSLMKEYFISLPDPDLAYLAQGTAEFKSYLADLLWAQDFAMRNRQEMLSRVLEQVYRHVYGPNDWAFMMTCALSQKLLLTVNCHHNYTSMENHFGSNVWITRKGAVSAREGEYGIIPGSMGVKSFIVKGKGNAESFCSCSHGAGRRMSRTKAKATFTTEDLAKQTLGVECRKDANVVDEIPGAYKDIDVVMANQADLVEPVFELKQLICIKG